MITRITYSKPNEKNERISNIIPNENGVPYRVTLFLDTMTFKIVRMTNKEIVFSTEKLGIKPASNEDYLKKQVRRYLQRVGVKFKVILKTPGFKGHKK